LKEGFPLVLLLVFQPLRKNSSIEKRSMGTIEEKKENQKVFPKFKFF
jgi:hypothetical protein